MAFVQPRESLDTLDDLTEEAPCQVAFRQLKDGAPAARLAAGPFAPSPELLRGEGRMGKMLRAALGSLLLVLGLAGCADFQGGPTVVTSQQECQRSGGIWRAGDAYCERSAGGGGGY